VEVCLSNQSSALDREQIESLVESFLLKGRFAYLPRGVVDLSDAPDTLRANVDRIRLSYQHSEHEIGCWAVDLEFFIYHLNTEEAAEEMIDDDITACSQYMLPCAQFEGLWESLIYADSTKERMLKYASTALLFADRGVDSNIISWNRAMLLHGPPGTG
jgi:pachytene checkpoint protein 2